MPCDQCNTIQYGYNTDTIQYNTVQYRYNMITTLRNNKMQ
jgi:hypothetical protein